MKIPIKKTNSKVPRSCYLIYTSGSNLSFDPAGIAFRLVRDISKGLPDPIQFFDTEIVKQQKGDWNEWHKDMEEQVPKYSGSRIYYSKPSLRNRWLTRIKRIRRKK